MESFELNPVIIDHSVPAAMKRIRLAANFLLSTQPEYVTQRYETVTDDGARLLIEDSRDATGNTDDNEVGVHMTFTPDQQHTEAGLTYDRLSGQSSLDYEVAAGCTGRVGLNDFLYCTNSLLLWEGLNETERILVTHIGNIILGGPFIGFNTTQEGLRIEDLIDELLQSSSSPSYLHSEFHMKNGANHQTDIAQNRILKPTSSSNMFNVPPTLEIVHIDAKTGERYTYTIKSNGSGHVTYELDDTPPVVVPLIDIPFINPEIEIIVMKTFYKIEAAVNQSLFTPQDYYEHYQH